VVYVGDGRSRDVIRAFEFPGAPSNRSRPYGFEAIITTYELVLKVCDQVLCWLWVLRAFRDALVCLWLAVRGPSCCKHTCG
jgi:hypothetical protein